MSMTLPWRIPSYGPAIETSLTTDEALELQELARDRKVLEIGAAFGYSTVLMARTAKHVLSVDPHQAHQSLEIHTRNLEHYGVAAKVARIVAPSRQALPPLDRSQFDLVFVDGEHTAEGVAFDLQKATELVRLDGVIAFHDWDETTCPEIRPTLEKLWRQPDYLVDTLAVYRV